MRAKNIGKADESTQEKMDKGRYRLTLLSVPTLIWYLIFSYLPMFGIVIAFKQYKLAPGGHGFIYNLFHSDWAGFGNFEYFFCPMLFLCCFATPFSTTLYLSLSVPVLR